MFQRRLKIILGILIAFTGMLVLRAVQVQVINHGYWSEQAVRVMTRPELIETTRGRLLDRRGRVIAQDQPCIDACVDYRAIGSRPDPDWVRSVALRRLNERMGRDYRAADSTSRRQLLEEEIGRVQTDIKIMWETLGRLGGMSGEELDETRQAIVRKVEMRRRFVWYHKYQQAMKEQENRDPSPWYRRWLIDDTQAAPELDQFDLTVAEQTQAHVILRAISNETHNYLGKNQDRFPGLELVPSMHRYYPYADAGCHLIGHLARVTRDDLAGERAPGNDLRRYWPNDLIGRTGLEALCEPLLRGTRGRIERYFGEEEREIARSEPVPGKDVYTTIDIDLQNDIQSMFREVELEKGREWKDVLAMPGAAVVIDVPSGEVLALASYPGFDLNQFDELYPRLVEDDINRPLMNRATQFALEPGSTVKPMVGLGAITDGLMTVDGTVECTGYLQLDGRTYRTEGRCWVASNFYQQLGGNVAHHPIPWDAPHPTGFLTFPDALERSCNVYFETVADRLGIAGLAKWFDRFGLGRPTGLGIPEASGRLPGDGPLPAYRRRAAAWFSGIGQDQVLATPIQMANVAATIARGGIWMRPRLVRAERGMLTPTTAPEGPDTVNLHLSPAALAAAREGMTRVVNSLAGTGQKLKRADMVVAGKTGSAQAAPLTIPRRDELGRKAMKTVMVARRDEASGQMVEIERKVPERIALPLGTHAHPDRLAPWYRGTGDAEDKRSHAWVIGFAPAQNPKIAFAVLVEYGGGGGASAGSVAQRMLDACVEHRYLERRPVQTANAE